MPTLVDANYIIQWFVASEPKHAHIAQVLFKDSEPETLIIDRITTAEVTYVLRKHGYNRKQIYKLFEELFYYASIAPITQIESVALTHYRETKLDYEDCYLLAAAMASQHQIATFDKALLKMMR